MTTMVISDFGSGSRKSRRGTAKKYIEWAGKELDMSPADIARLAGYGPSTVRSYLVGRRLPSLTFLLDLADKIPHADPKFEQIASLLGLRRIGIAEPFKYRRRSLAFYLAAVRVTARRTRDQFAAKLGVTAQSVWDVEHGRVPDRKYLQRVVRIFLPAATSIDDIVAAFRVLRPTPVDIKIQCDLERIQLLPAADPQRSRLENALAAELIPIATRIATSLAWKMNRPEYAEEVVGEGIMLAIRFHDPARGLFLSYLKSRIAGLLHDLVRANLQSGTATILCDYGAAVREAEELLQGEFGRFPSEEEVAGYLDIRPRIVGEVRRARVACSPVSIDYLDFLLEHAVDIGSRPASVGDSRYSKRLQEMPDEWCEIIYLHFHDHLSVAEIAHLTNTPESAVVETIDLALIMLRGDSPRDPAGGEG